jgi:hypothetical protein
VAGLIWFVVGFFMVCVPPFRSSFGVIGAPSKVGGSLPSLPPGSTNLSD